MKKYIKVFYCLLILVLIAVSYFGCHIIKLAKAINNEKIITQNFIQEIPLLFYNNAIATKVIIKDSSTKVAQSLYLSIDTEAPFCIENKYIVNTGDYITDFGWTKSVDQQKIDTRRYSIPFVDIGSVSFKNILTLNCPANKKRCNNENIVTSGFLGNNVLNKAIWFFDITNSKIKITDNVKYLEKEIKYFQKHFGFNQSQHGLNRNSIYVDIHLNKKDNSMRQMLDLGYNLDIAVSKKEWDNINKQEANLETWYGYIYETLSENNRIDTVCFLKNNSIDLWGYTINGVTLEYSPQINFNLIGTNVISKFDFVLDYLNRSIYVKPNNNFSKSPPFYLDIFVKDFTLNNNTNGIYVNKIKKNGIADTQGLHISDTILAYNNQVINYNEDACKHWVALNNLLKQPDVLNLQIKRSNKIINIIL